MSDTLLVEVLTEELPPKSLQQLAQNFAEAVSKKLQNEQFVEPDSACQVYATPRRLGFTIAKVKSQQADRQIEAKGPSLAVALDASGSPTPALLGFAKKNGVNVEQLQRASDGKSEYFVYRDVAKGASLSSVLNGVIEDALKKLPSPKLMRWGDNDSEFVRPVHGVMMLHGGQVIPGPVLGLETGNITKGHRFLGKSEIKINNADEYEQILLSEGSVIASFVRRMQVIETQLREKAEDKNAVFDSALLSEVAALVEFPTVYRGQFDSAFLEVPQECLILSMKQHQKYFPLIDEAGKLLPKFLITSNNKPSDPSNIIHGNERVLRARLSDAKFFFDQDRKQPLQARVPLLDKVVYHNKLGSQLDRVQRIQKLASAIINRLGGDVESASRAAYLCKADLLTEMVGEFPELQGVMGKYYALYDGESNEVAVAIEEHYRPRVANDALPIGKIAQSVALADKLDTLIGMFGIGAIPTGDKDPFALRRNALGVLRILCEASLELDLLELLQWSKSYFPDAVLSDSVVMDVYTFMLERLKNYLPEGIVRDEKYSFTADEIEAVVSQNPTRIDLIVPRLLAVQSFRALPEAQSLASANKRIRNILKKTQVPDAQPDLQLMQEPAEKAVFEAMRDLEPKTRSYVAGKDYAAALRELASVRNTVDRFFDEVMVMVEEPMIRNNRLALLNQLSNLMNQVADISKLATQ